MTMVDKIGLSVIALELLIFLNAWRAWVLVPWILERKKRRNS